MKAADITLDDIITPGTDKDVVDAYRTLAERARTRRFGLLEDDVIVLDTETTGLDFKACELIEVAAARLRGTEIVEEFDMFVHPQSPIPPEIVELTGITNQMVADAADAATVMEAFCAFAGDEPLIAHNAVFDHHFLKKGAGHDVGAVWIDSLELSRIVLPCLSSHKLTDLSRAFGVTPSTHRAIDDVRALCGVWRVLLTAASDLPAGLLGYLANLYPEVPWSYRPVFTQIAAEFPDVPFSLRDARVERCGHREASARPDARDLAERGALSFPSPDEVAAQFGPDGVVRRMYDGFEPRDEQVVMARTVAEAFAENRMAAIEAGTGVGKSIAYLLPAAMLAQRNGVTVGVATKSNALADQLMNHELPLLSRALDKPLSYVALKGYDNYPCLRKVERLAYLGHRPARGADGVREMPADVPAPSEDLLNAIAAIASFAVQSAEGDLNSLGIRWGKVMRSDLTCAVGECQKRRCPFFPNRCFLHGARRRAAAADVVVTNHSLLFRTAGSDIDVLPPIRRWVVDEAHSCEDEARRQWAMTVNSREVTSAFDKLGSASGGALGGLAKEATGVEGAGTLIACVSKAASEASRAVVAASTFFDDVRRLVPRQRKRGGYETEVVWLNAEVRASEAFAAVEESGRAFEERLDAVVTHAQEAADASADPASAPAGRNDDLAARRDELVAVISTLSETLVALRLILDGSNERYVYSLGVNQRRGYESFELAAELVDVGSELARRWYPEVDSVVYSSATIAVGDEFGHFNHQVGFDELPPHSYLDLRLDSSYDFENHMSVLVANDIPEPNAPGYLDALARLLVGVHEAMGGSVLTLFTNRHDMEETFRVVEPELARHGQMLLCQESGANVRHLRERFVAEKGSSLFALRSFWEGFDAAGDTLRCVVIPKLPFQRPTDPIALERDRREKNSWSKYALPDAVLTMKQAAGRLIRTSSDHGCLVLADRRLLSKGYGKVFLRALPKRSYDAVSMASIPEVIKLWRKGSSRR